jgi:phosphoglycolate phosphatase-like HAD superfamily hydrolase
MADSHTALLPFDAVLFDLDGVLTSTAKIHAACWKSMFDDFLRRHAHDSRAPFTPFDLESDYKLSMMPNGLAIIPPAGQHGLPGARSQR